MTNGIRIPLRPPPLPRLPGWSARVVYHKDELHNLLQLPAPLKLALGLPTPLLSTLLHL